jgi:hypothetical protein
MPGATKPNKRPHGADTKDNPGNAKKSRTKRVNKENIIPKNDSTAAAAVEEDEILGGKSRWSDADKTKLFEWLLGAEADDRFKIHNKNPERIYKKVAICPGI